MTEKNDLYYCSNCGNLIEVVITGKGELICCNKPMKLLDPKEVDAEYAEKHIPVIDKKDNNIEIRIGSILHPMEENHHINFIEAISDDEKYLKRKYLSIGEEPILKFSCNSKEPYSCVKGLVSREYCNIHGLWRNKNE